MAINTDIFPQWFSCTKRAWHERNTTTKRQLLLVLVERREMFPDAEYYQINREERHFGFLFMSALALNLDARRNIVAYINSTISGNIDPTQIDVYAEVCLFRDHWRALGDPAKYSSETHSHRLQIFLRMLEVMELDTTMLESEPVFWTGQPGESKLFYPGKWHKDKINNAEKTYGLKAKELWRLRWACNAKPDVMIEDPENVVFVEIKVESDFGKSDNGYSQLQTQRDILRIGKSLIPSMANKRTELTTLTLDGKGLVWPEIIRILEATVTPGVFEMINRHLIAMPK